MMQTLNTIDTTTICERAHRDIDNGTYDALAIAGIHRQELVLHEAIGFASRETGKALTPDHTFLSMSMGKQFTATLALMWIERSHLSLTMPVAEVIEEFSRGGREVIQLWHLLAHRSGLPMELPFGLDPMQIGDLDANMVALGEIRPVIEPGSGTLYSAVMNHAVIGALIERTDPQHRRLRDIFRDELFDPLGMYDTALGFPAHLMNRLAAPLDGPTDDWPGFSKMPYVLPPDSQIAGGGFLTTSGDMSRFITMLAAGGYAGDRKILSRATLDRARKPIDPMPAVFGPGLGYRSAIAPGFLVRGNDLYTSPFGTLSSPETFGGLGHGTTCFWYDPI